MFSALLNSKNFQNTNNDEKKAKLTRTTKTGIKYT